MSDLCILCAVMETWNCHFSHIISLHFVTPFSQYFKCNSNSTSTSTGLIYENSWFGCTCDVLPIGNIKVTPSPTFETKYLSSGLTSRKARRKYARIRFTHSEILTPSFRTVIITLEPLHLDICRREWNVYVYLFPKIHHDTSILQSGMEPELVPPNSLLLSVAAVQRSTPRMLPTTWLSGFRRQLEYRGEVYTATMYYSIQLLARSRLVARFSGSSTVLHLSMTGVNWDWQGGPTSMF